jgi:hypothetical protein
MARTRKKFPWGWGRRGCFRNPRGKQQALRGNARKGAIPPDAWDDRHFDKQCWLPIQVAKRLVRKAWNPYDIINHLVHRYGVDLKTAREVVELEMYGSYWWPYLSAKVYDEASDTSGIG